jgi:hypothetical protein
MSSSGRDERLFWLGAVLWVAVIAATWPSALSFGDEVGYVAQAKLFLAGHVHYIPSSPGAWVSSPHGLVNKYPLFHSLLLTPFIAATPRAAFAVAVMAAIVLAATARQILKSWGKSPLWALLVLAHPTVVILARTTMADVPQAAAVLAGWWALRRGRAAATVLWLAFLVAIKPTGAVLGLALVAGEALANLGALRARDAATWRRFGWAAAGGVAGLIVVLSLNRLSTGSLWFAYLSGLESTPKFWYRHFPERAPAYVALLLLNPPLLIMGALPYWRRRELGPLALSLGYVALMSFYFFIDTAPTRLESAVLAPRLVLPSVALLLVGYGAWLEGLLARRAPASFALPRWAAATLVAVPLVTAAAVSVRHARFQRRGAHAVAAASYAADRVGGHTLGLTYSSAKTALLYDGATTVYDPETNRPAVVLCSEHSPSYRVANDFACDMPGYTRIAADEGMVALLRDDVRPAP